MRTWLVQILTRWLRVLRQLQSWLLQHGRRKRPHISVQIALPRRVFTQPKPTWVKHEVVRLKALMPQAGCRTIAHLFNRRWTPRRGMTVSKTYVADTCRKHQ
jgi:hypothetical protein